MTSALRRKAGVVAGRVEVVPGGHLVASVDGVIVVVAHRDPEPVTADSRSMMVLETVLRLVRDSASRETRRTGRAFAQSVSDWIMNRDDEDRIEFGVLTPGTRGLAVFLHGNVTAVLDGDRKEVLHGRDAGFSVDRMVVPPPSHAAAVFVDEEHPRDDLPAPGIWSLTEGRMPGAGAVAWFTETPPNPSEQGAAARSTTSSAAGERTADQTPLSLDTGDSGGREANPVESDRARQPRGWPSVRVRGYECPRHHLNDPRSTSCGVCGYRIDQLSGVPAEGVRPSLGMLRLDDGSAYPLDADLVIGREPELSAQVRHGARAVRVEDGSGGMSRVHAEIRLVGWDVTVLDRGSANGTHVRSPARPEWTRATPGHPVILAAGSQVLLGGRIFTFDSAGA